MKYLFIVLFALLLFFSLSNSLKLRDLKVIIDKISEKNNSLQSELSIYRNSFKKEIRNLEFYVSYLDSTQNKTDSCYCQLVFFFTNADCNSCIEIQIANLNKFSENNKLNILVSTELNNSDKLDSFHKIYKKSYLTFALINGQIPSTKMCYFILWPSGRISNLFFPDELNLNATDNFLSDINHYIIKEKTLNVSLGQVINKQE